MCNLQCLRDNGVSQSASVADDHTSDHLRRLSLSICARKFELLDGAEQFYRFVLAKRNAATAARSRGASHSAVGAC
eukprot:636601-Pyramimonas_sp.AAC.1